MGQWVGSGHITKNLINLDLIEIMQLYLKIYDLRRHPHLWVCERLGGYVGQWVGQWVKSCQITKNLINLDLIKIIQYGHFGHFLDILLKPPQPLMGLFFPPKMELNIRKL